MQVPIPDEEQEQLLVQMGIDPEQYGVIYSSEDMFKMKHYKTGNEVTIWMNRRVKRDC